MSVTEIEATYRVVTPLFCAGTAPNRPELRLSSFKGVLRFWWRALAWSQYHGNLKKIQAQEDCLFGSAGGGQSRVSLRLKPVNQPQPVFKDSVLRISQNNKRTVGEGARYLGYGVMGAFGAKAGRLERACLSAPFDFTVQIRGRNLDETQLDDLTLALVALGTLGGMGSKSRKGYGSLSICSLDINGNKPVGRLPRSMGEMITMVQWSSHFKLSGFPKYTALSNKARIVLVSSAKKDPLALLDLIGRELMRYRSWGFKGKVLGNPAEQNFIDDRELMKLPVAQRKNHPRRIAFGLPHNYGPGQAQMVEPHDRQLDRRASPLFIHIHECKHGPVAILSFLPAEFLPAGRSHISVGGQKIRQKPESELYGPIHDFLDRLLDPAKCKEKFTERLEVK